ncbi:hypothetical protein GCM10020229_76400 [Kitasatospora albolonga]
MWAGARGRAAGTLVQVVGAAGRERVGGFAWGDPIIPTRMTRPCHNPLGGGPCAECQNAGHPPVGVARAVHRPLPSSAAPVGRAVGVERTRGRGESGIPGRVGPVDCVKVLWNLW